MLKFLLLIFYVSIIPCIIHNEALGRVVENRVRRETTTSENPFGFTPEKLTTKAIYLLKISMEKL